MRKNKIQILLLIFITVFTTGLIQPSLLEAADYDFGEVEIGSTETTTVNITNMGGSPVTISIKFDNTDCSDFSAVSEPEFDILPDGTLQVEVGFTPSKIGTCSDTLRIYDGPFFYLKTLTGTGVESVSDQPEPINISRSYLNQKVTICHTPPGNPSKAKTLSIGVESVDAHLAHGDTLGECP
jgi:hypothetical protein